MLRQKSDGKLMMISDFVMERGTGRLALPAVLSGDRPQDLCDVRRVIEPGKNVEYWSLNQLCEQLLVALKIFDEAFPGKIGLFIFDNSSVHGGDASDALRAEKMNLGPGGNVPKMNHRWYLDQNGERKIEDGVSGHLRSHHGT